jgi:hypothetical protein
MSMVTEKTVTITGYASPKTGMIAKLSGCV